MKENSIEKDEEILNNIKAYMQENIDKGYHKFVYNDLGYDEKCVDVINAIEHIISDYKRTLKENEILKKEKEQAWGEWNNLEQGSYETEQKLKQQIKESQRENEELKNQEETARKVNELLVERYSTSIPVQKVKDKIRKNEEIIDISNDGDLIHELLQKNKVYEELLESEE